ncbi:MAG: 3'(2'),5'-bisphosphate nucleotidase [Limnospira sp. PMC 1291.21]|uniref:3'(2'),5'-bisphosphate nucleotidase n=3 Tax=Limnospira TaxID=2596745 RepID=A0A9P1KGH1_9CYAN|nr:MULTISPECIES: 3'(2'),5'-bisphosphate nucleotidase [Limnospira]EKD07601.1 3'(2')5'-bisphosphate nucleotidase [Arthrospira platensis C1]MDC0837331.1 3'(2'),5'-bisphosphate nucleotidase [Limnoraphis robusta]MDY7055616.1 3'(2'),5'-bisphosphate nucleotidase [Limnospira fusiformis LS22]QJB25668.1 3'(2'),5'-bisphosphate nucleotidase [Limnospira fusiformis SAG 85.79]RAQ43284.1 3'(2'),5'-bisphosphate nucleotidase [Arthrospira sp. O9.13F]
MPYDREKQVAIDAVLAASRLCEQVRQAIPPAMEKGDKSPVTVADFGSQAIICKAISEAFPDDPIVGEEDATTLKTPEMGNNLEKVTDYVRSIIPDATPEQVTTWIDHGNGSVGKRFWTLDPIDGTKGFLRKDQYAIALALIENGEVKLGIMGCPAYAIDGDTPGMLFVAVRGEGSMKMPFSTGKFTPIQVVKAENTQNMRFVESVEAAHGDQSRQNAIAQAAGITAPSVRMDSQAKYGVVASGQAALYLRLPSPKYPNYQENIWDHAAGAIVVEEAGGRVTDMHGKPLDFASSIKMVDNRGIVVSSGLIHDQVLAALKS